MEPLTLLCTVHWFIYFRHATEANIADGVRNRVRFEGYKNYVINLLVMVRTPQTMQSDGMCWSKSYCFCKTEFEVFDMGWIECTPQFPPAYDAILRRHAERNVSHHLERSVAVLSMDCQSRHPEIESCAVASNSGVN